MAKTNSTPKSAQRTRKSAGEGPPEPQGLSKLDTVVGLLQRPEGATVEALSLATGWQPHSVRGAMSGALKKQRGLTIVSEKTEAGRIYRIPAEAGA